MAVTTSPASVTAGLNAFDKKMIVIAGGSDKKLDYNELSEEINKHIKVLILMGETADKIELATKSHQNYNPDNIKIIRVSSMEEAVKTAQNNATHGDIVSLSPASASFDKYKDFEERGRHFKNIVKDLV